MKVSIIIKCLNEEDKISSAIKSSLNAINELNISGEVIVADCLSDDDTLKISQQFPVRIVQLVNKNHRSCGVGGEIGFRSSFGEYVFLIDGDMEVVSGFLEKALTLLDQNENIAGVAGSINEMNCTNLEFKDRVKRQSHASNYGDVFSLSGGGVYRSSAIHQIGYFTNQYLNSFEEFELGARLKKNGWRLVRLEDISVNHYGYTIDAFSLLLKRIRTGYIYGAGELLKSVCSDDLLPLVLRNNNHLKVISCYLLWIILYSCLLLFVDFDIYMFAVFFIPLLIMIAKKQSFSKGFYSFISGLVNAYGVVAGFLTSKKKNPLNTIPVQEFTSLSVEVIHGNKK